MLSMVDTFIQSNLHVSQLYCTTEQLMAKDLALALVDSEI